MSEEDDIQLEEDIFELFEETGGDVDKVLEALEQVPEERPARWCIHARLALTVGDLELAEEALARAEALAPDAPGTLWTRAMVAQDAWRIEEAARALEAYLEQFESPEALLSLALVRDCQGRTDDADELHARAHELAPEDVFVPHRMTPEQFEGVVNDAAQDLTREFRAELERIPVLIDPMPTRPPDPTQAPEVTPDVLGLFTGASRLDAPEALSGELPPTIHLFQRNIERVSPDLEVLVEQIQTTLYHELGHALGFDEDGVEDLGLA